MGTDRTAPGPEVRARYEDAATRLTEDLEADATIVAAVLWGSVAYADVWDRSDIDLTIVFADGKKILSETRVLLYEDVFVHAQCQHRTAFIRHMDGGMRGGFHHHMVLTGRLLFSRDTAIDALYDDVGTVAGRDQRAQVFQNAAIAGALLAKAEKWFRLRDDLAYSALWLLKTTEALARVEVYRNGEVAQREVLDQALELNPEFFDALYSDCFARKLSPSALRAKLDLADGYLDDNRYEFFGPLLDHLAEEPDVVGITDVAHELHRRQGLHDVALAVEWLSDHGYVERVPLPARLSRTSKVDVQELGVVSL